MISTVPIDALFGATAKPEHFTNFRHCDECREHDETLRAHTRESISLAELGNPGWDPICFVNSIEGFRYYLPALARLSLGRGDGYYLSQFLFHLNPERISALRETECQALADFLEHLMETMPEEIEENLDSDDLLARIETLSGART